MANRKNNEESDCSKSRRDFIKFGCTAALAAMAVQSMPLSAKIFPSSLIEPYSAFPFTAGSKQLSRCV
ncbi:twin-arginine translocation signal domain-containing protein [Shewanella sp. 202IG2-18]|uniref:twin-arginine translocation signal domain-containing protein n=1 Tax=Parashewanella hymeniacidonis TaxID=2807618 RepID=UPI00195F4036|nr:twin-arginine translocation signal domain-containing protein [Parashewanella hymeniacidonis]MBM7071436.1 twin-arginine translocation signal domain-containing protein [Parashewanella hymeniacidonis]